MKRIAIIALITIALLIYSCAEIDKIAPIISSLEVNGKSGETIYIGVPNLTIEYEVSDNEFVVDSKIKIVEDANLDSGYFYLNIQSLGVGRYEGMLTVTIPDSVFQLSTPLTISIDAFDDSGNQAIQVKSTIIFK